MKGSTHVFFGTLLGGGFQLVSGLHLYGLTSYPLYYGGVVLGSLLPDIDHPQSYLGRRIPLLSVPINRLFGHRGFTHSILFLTLTGLSTAFSGVCSPIFIGGLLLGIFSHFIGDMITPSGIPLFYPNKKRYKFFKKRRFKR